MKSLLRTSFGSALLGGLVVAVFGWIAIAAGLIKSDGSSSTSPSMTALAAPVASHGGGEGEGNVVNQIYKADGQGVAFVQATEEPEETQFGLFGETEQSGGGVATGSGFVIDTDGHLLTNNHVVEGAEKIEVKLGSSEKSYAAKVVGTDPSTDIALLKVDAPQGELHPLQLGNSSEVEVGDPVVAIGNPFGLDRTVTSGIVSALQRQIEAPAGFSISHVIQTDAAINPGNSGGPLIDAEGRVIGINSQIETGGSSEGNVGIGFAIPIDTAREVAEQIEETGKVEHAYLGIEGGSVTPELAKALNLPADHGVLVASVAKGGPAAKAGIKGGNTSATIEGAEVTLGGDIIVKLEGKTISEMEDLVSVIEGKRPGDEMEVTVLRDGKEQTLTVTLGNRPASVK
jgi:S1-C subfamily serine protease